MQEYDLYLNGTWQKPSSSMDVLDPATGKVFAKVATVEQSHVTSALDAAHGALDAWRGLTAQARGQYLHRIADAVEARVDEMARLITLENGKPLAQSKGEVAMTADHFRWFAEEGRRTYGRVIPPQTPGKHHMVYRVGVGVVGAIAPWNFPVVLATRKVAPALAAGCPVILKPASATPISTVCLAQCVEDAGLPAGVFQIVVGNAQMISDALFSNPICRKVSFTGSTQVGRKLLKASAQNVVSLSMELGGHAPMLVFEDSDLDLAVEGAMIAKFRNSGQSCIAANRIYVQRSIYQRFCDAFVEKTRALKVGNGFEQGVDVGPLIDQRGLTSALAQVDNALKAGAKLLCGGKRILSETGGFFLEPTVLADVSDDAQCMKEETFAPIAPVCVFDDEDEVIRRANDSEYGLAAYAFTRDLNRAMRLSNKLEAGTVCINDAVPATSQCPFGGMKNSGLGRELGVEGLDAYLETKHISIAGL